MKRTILTGCGIRDRIGMKDKKRDLRHADPFFVERTGLEPVTFHTSSECSPS